MVARVSPEFRFPQKIQKDQSGCWLWTGYVDPSGYARFRTPGELRAHRWSYTHFVGPIPDGMVIDHICRVRHCVNPEHLRVVTSRENTLAPGSEAPAKSLLESESCARGHLWGPENTVVSERQRYCRTCHIEDNRRQRASKRSPLCPQGHAKIASRDGKLYCSICHRAARVKAPS